MTAYLVSLAEPLPVVNLRRSNPSSEPSVKYSLRRLLKSPAFALTAILTVGAAIGANALIFSVVNGVILKPLPYAEPKTLVGAWLVAPGVMPGPLQQSAGTYFMLRDSAESFQDIGLWQSGSVTITGRGEPEQIETLFVTDGTLPILGIRPALGRAFSKEDDLPNGPNVVLITHRLLAARLRRQSVGRRPELDGQRHARAK